MSDAPGKDRLDATTLMNALVARAPGMRAAVQARLPDRLKRVLSPDDILQEVWITAFQNIDSFRMDRKDALDRWITVIFQNEVVSILKTEMRIKRGGEARFARSYARSGSFADRFDGVESPGRSPSRVVAVGEAGDAVQVALASIQEARREALILRFLENCSLDEIATRMGRSKSSIQSLLYFGLRDLEKLLGPASLYFSDATSIEHPDIVPEAI